MKNLKRIGLSFFFLASLSLALSSCGYRFSNQNGWLQKNATLSIPYVLGDQEGALTATLIREVVRVGTFQYRDHEGAYLLNVKLLDIDEDNIGFRYDRKKKGTLTQEIIPTETRILAVVELSLIESGTGTTLLGPVRLSAAVDYDHDYYFSRNGVNIFSLGQLTDIDTAYDSVQHPLYQALARKIVAYISQNW